MEEMKSRARQIMGQPKTDRTEQLHTAARRYTVAQQVNRAIEQHNFTKLVRQGVNDGDWDNMNTTSWKAERSRC